MLIQNKEISEGDIVTLKMTYSEECLGKLVEQDMSTVTLAKPMSMVAGQQGLGLGPFSFTVPSDTNITINRSAIAWMAKTDKEIANQYIQTTTGIHVA